MTPHWRDQNPWRDQIVYVPIERLAECVAGGTIRMGTYESVPYDVAFVLKHWAGYGDKLDAYILPQPHPALHSIGIRYGAEGSQYLSPHNANPELTQKLLEEFS